MHTSENKIAQCGTGAGFTIRGLYVRSFAMREGSVLSCWQLRSMTAPSMGVCLASKVSNSETAGTMGDTVCCLRRKDETQNRGLSSMEGAAAPTPVVRWDPSSSGAPPSARQKTFQRRCHKGENEWPRESASDGVILTGRRRLCETKSLSG